jgi:hypothetical protein
MTTNNTLVRLEQSLQASSLTDLVQEMSDFPMLLIDVSGSMSNLMNNGKTRIMGLREAVTTIIAENGQPTMIAFGGQETDEPRFVDHVPGEGGGTPLHRAIPLAKSYGATRLVVISDGEPDLREESMIAARAFGGSIDVYYVGNPGDSGSFFLDQLAQATGGKRFNGDLTNAKQLAAGVAGLLMGSTEPEQTVFAAGPSGEVEHTDTPVLASDDVDDDDVDDDDDDDVDEDEDDEEDDDDDDSE